MGDHPRHHRERQPDDDPEIPDLHLQELERLARQAPGKLARRADEAIARRAPNLAPSRLRGRLRRRTVALLAMLALMAAVATFWAVLRQTSLLRETLEAQLSERLGAKVSIGEVDWNGWSTLVATDLSLRVEGWPESANEVASIRRAVVVFEPTSLLAGRIQLVDMEIEGLTVRVVERAAAPGLFNLFELRPMPGTSAAPMGQPQTAMLRDLRLEFGVLRDNDVQWFGRQAYEGSFEHTRDDPSVYAFNLVQREQDGKPVDEAPIRIFGTWNERTFAYEATLDGLDLGTQARTFLPLQARTWATRAGISGRVEGAHIQGSAAQPVAFAEIAVRDLVLRERDVIRSVPWGRMEGEAITAIGGDVSLSLGQGTLTLRGSELSLSAQQATLRPGKPGGEAMAIPVDVALSLDLNFGSGLPFDWDSREDWAANALALAKFQVRVQLREVDARPHADGSPRVIELPMVVVEALKEFGARDWAAGIDLTLSRAAPTVGADGTLTGAPVVAKGVLTLQDGSVRYKGFPYQLDHVQGAIEIDGPRATVRQLRGRGTGDAELTLTGEVHVVGSDPGYDLAVKGRAVPVDDRLMGSFREAPARIFTTLFDRRSWEALREAGLAEEASRPGGLVDFDLQVRHDVDGGEVIAVLGTVDIQHAQMVLDAFPYPMSVQGQLRLEDERVVLAGEGIQARTPAGGVGRVTGIVGIPREGTSRRVENDLRFHFEHERLARPMLAAVPASFAPGSKPPPGWPGKVFAPISQLMLALGAEGDLTIDGSVRTQPDRSERVETTAVIRDGTIRPDENLPRVMRRFGLAWPGKMGLDGVAGTVHIAPEGLVLEGLIARHGGGEARAHGRFSTDGESGTLTVDLTDFPIERDFLGLGGDGSVEVAERAWDALQPSGSFDGGVVWVKQGEATSTWAVATPRSIVLAERVPLEPVCGHLFYRDGEIELDSIDLRGPDVDDTPLHIMANGRITGPQASFEASVEDIAIDSPVVSSALRAAGMESLRDMVRDWALHGRFDAAFDLRGDRPEEPWRLQVHPDWLSGVHEGRPFAVCVQSGQVVGTPAGARIEDLTATNERGWLSVAGEVRPNRAGGVRADLMLGGLLCSWSGDAGALLPLAARNALDQIGFSSTGPLWTDGLRVMADITAEGVHQVAVVGDIGVSDASFDTGVHFDQAGGMLTFDLATQDGTPDGRIELAFDQLRFLGRVATGVTAQLRFDDISGGVALEELHGTMYGGRLVGRARVDPTEGYELHVAFANIGFASFADAPNAPGGGSGTGVVDLRREGALRGRFDVRGSFDAPELRRGSGRAAVVDGKMVSFPLGLSLLQLTQLMLPLSASLDRADIDFTLTGDSVNFEKLNLASGTMRLEGDGKLDISDGAIALRFRNRGQVPILSDLYGVVADQLFVIDVGGTFRDPQPRLTPIPVFSPSPKLEPAPAAPPTAPGTATPPTTTARTGAAGRSTAE